MTTSSKPVPQCSGCPILHTRVASCDGHQLDADGFFRYVAQEFLKCHWPRVACQSFQAVCSRTLPGWSRIQILVIRSNKLKVLFKPPLFSDGILIFKCLKVLCSTPNISYNNCAILTLWSAGYRGGWWPGAEWGFAGTVCKVHDPTQRYRWVNQVNLEHHLNWGLAEIEKSEYLIQLEM